MQVSVVQFRPWAPPPKNAPNITALFRKRSHLARKWDPDLSRIRSRKGSLIRACALRTPRAFLIGLARVNLRLLQRVPSEDGHEHVPRGSVLRRDGRASLAEAVGCAMWKVRLVAPIAKLVAKA